MAQAGVFTAGGPPAHLSSLSHLPSIRNSEISYSFFSQSLQSRLQPLGCSPAHHSRNPLKTPELPHLLRICMHRFVYLGQLFTLSPGALFSKIPPQEFLPPGSLPHHSIQGEVPLSRPCSYSSLILKHRSLHQNHPKGLSDHRLLGPPPVSN